MSTNPLPLKLVHDRVMEALRTDRALNASCVDAESRRSLVCSSERFIVKLSFDPALFAGVDEPRRAPALLPFATVREIAVVRAALKRYERAHTVHGGGSRDVIRELLNRLEAIDA